MNVTYASEERITIWLIAAVMVVCGDALTTTVALTTIPQASEANPVIAAMIGSIGVVPAMIVKQMIGAALAIFLAYCAERGYPFAWMRRNWRFQPVTRATSARRAFWMLFTLTALHFLVIVNNIKVILEYT